MVHVYKEESFKVKLKSLGSDKAVIMLSKENLANKPCCVITSMFCLLKFLTFCQYFKNTAYNEGKLILRCKIN